MRYWDNNSLNTQFGAQTRPQREFLGHEVRSFFSQLFPQLTFLPICRMRSIPWPSRLTANGSLWVHLINQFVSGTCTVTRQYSVVSVIIKEGYIRLISPTGRYLASGVDDGTVGIWRYSYTTPGGLSAS